MSFFASGVAINFTVCDNEMVFNDFCEGSGMYEVIARKVWTNPAKGFDVSVSGAMPAGDGWNIVDAGFTVRNVDNGTTGCYGLSAAISEGRVDPLSFDSVAAWVTAENNRKAAIRRRSA